MAVGVLGIALCGVAGRLKELDLEQQAVTTTANRASACIQLYKALGGGWSHL